MSVFLCSSNHIAVLAKYCYEKSIYLGDQWSSKGTMHSDLIARALARCNINSVINNDIDATNDKADKIHINECADVARSADISEHSPIQIYKLAQCLEYNSDASDNWDNSNVKALVDEIKRKAINETSGYADAKWAI